MMVCLNPGYLVAGVVVGMAVGAGVMVWVLSRAVSLWR